MNKHQLIKQISLSTGFTMKDIEEIFDTLVETMGNCVETGDEFKISGFGTLSIIDIPERNGYNNKLKQKVIYPKTKKVIFSLSDKIKRRPKKT